MIKNNSPKNKDKFKVLLINISLRPESTVHLFPIGLGYIATAIDNAGYKLEILDIDKLRLSDTQFEEYIKTNDFDIIAMGCIVTGYKFVKNYCELIKKYTDIPIIVGNSVASSIPEILVEKTKADIGVIGEGDITIIELLEALRQNKPIKDVKGIFYKEGDKIIFTDKREIIQNIDNLPFINFDLFDIEFYIEKSKRSIPEPYPLEYEKLRGFPVNTARGCPFNCTFCYHVFRDEKYRRRSVENIVKEIKLVKEKYKVNFIFFWDELSISSKKRANQIAEKFIQEDLNIFWSGDCRAGLFKDNEEDLALAKKLKESGCLGLAYSLENADPDILEAMNKHITVEGFIEQSKLLQKAGLSAWTSLVIGYPQETLKSIKKTFDVCNECNIYPSAGYLLPQPGTKMYEVAKEMGQIKDDEEYLLKMGDRQDFRINLTKLRQEEIEEQVKKSLKKISDNMKLNLGEKNLIKTQHYRQKKKNNN